MYVPMVRALLFTKTRPRDKYGVTLSRSKLPGMTYSSACDYVHSHGAKFKHGRLICLNLYEV